MGFIASFLLMFMPEHVWTSLLLKWLFRLHFIFWMQWYPNTLSHVRMYEIMAYFVCSLIPPSSIWFRASIISTWTTNGTICSGSFTTFCMFRYTKQVRIVSNQRREHINFNMFGVQWLIPLFASEFPFPVNTKLNTLLYRFLLIASCTYMGFLFPVWFQNDFSRHYCNDDFGPGYVNINVHSRCCR